MFARVLKLVYSLDLKSSGLMPVRVRVPPRAQKRGDLSLQEQYTFSNFSSPKFLKIKEKLFDPLPQAKQLACLSGQKEKTERFRFFLFVRSEGIEPPTVSLRGSCSTS